MGTSSALEICGVTMPPTLGLEPKQAAELYAEKGYAVFPVFEIEAGKCACSKGAQCTSPGKHPRTQNGVGAATTNKDQIADWWCHWPRANIGLATGVPSGVWVLDVDPDKSGELSLGSLEEDHGTLPDTWQAQTGSGGRHIFFRHEEDLPNRVGQLGPGLDVRSTGGYVVVAPSVHNNGCSYRWLNDLPLPKLQTGLR